MSDDLEQKVEANCKCALECQKHAGNLYGVRMHDGKYYCTLRDKCRFKEYRENGNMPYCSTRNR